MDLLYITLGVVAVIVIAVIVMYNSIVAGYEKVKQAWADVLTQENQKQKILPKLEEALKGYEGLEERLQTKITELRSGTSNLSPENIDVSHLKTLENQSNSLMKSLQLTVEDYPDLKASDLYKSFMQEITEQQENVGAALRIFNHNVQSHNTSIQSFPLNLVNGTMNKKPVVDMFTEQNAAESVGFTPNL